MRNFVISVDGVPAPDLGIFASELEANRHLSKLLRNPALRASELCVIAYARKRFRRAAAA